MRGAAAVSPITNITSAAAMLLVGFDYLVAAVSIALIAAWRACLRAAAADPAPARAALTSLLGCRPADGEHSAPAACADYGPTRSRMHRSGCQGRSRPGDLRIHSGRDVSGAR